MLKVTIPEIDLWNAQSEEFVTMKAQTLQLEHSLVSLSKWESKWRKPFLSKGLTVPESIDYIRCMTLTQNVDPVVYGCIPQNILDEINAYIDAPMTATTFAKDEKKTANREIVTAEIIYYWMVAHNIPFECQKWHLNRLLTLINVCNVKNKPPKKMSKRELLARNRALNAARLKQFNTTG